MPAAVYRGEQTIAVEHLSVPWPGAGEALIEVSHCGICGSDLHLVMEDMGRPGSIGGHEYSGVVVALGSGVTGWDLGAKVVGGPGRGCGVCRPCERGHTNLCVHKDQPGVAPFQGAFARYKCCRVDALYRVPDGLDLRIAALTEPTAVALRGVRRSGARSDDRVLVTGAGPIGLLTIAVLKASGVDDITVSEPAAARRQRALMVGARRVVEPAELPPPPVHPAGLADEPFDVAFECSGRATATETAVGLLARSGTLVLSGTGLKRPRLDANRVILNELVVTGTVEYVPSDYRDALALLDEGRLPVDALIEPDDVGLAGLQHAMKLLVAGELAGKVMVVPRA
jgi:threonine dehydrogenase-like Zn-dependent dehydrogenase